ncbi:uncharacterized protein LOC114253787 [Monomorium pharaonis]|uniref:uncharacterized protein LOC114253787 n=1 Tax=Monomorium pharaonis TaxID=307658 RepID=UPI00102E1208|nr:uncharacterized protein LOC114253787 [Monomorium pharaonis]
MKHLVTPLILFALTAGQVVRLPSSYQSGVKWEFGTNVVRGDVLARSNVDHVVPTVYKKELVSPITRGEPEPVVAVYKELSMTPDIYNPVVPTVYRKEDVGQNVHKQHPIIPTVFKAHPVASNIYKSEPVVQNVYKQQAAPVPIVHKVSPVVANVHQLKVHQPVQPVVHHQEQLLLQDYVPKNLPLHSQPQQEVLSHSWNDQYNPDHAFVHDNVHVVPHN